MLTTRIEIQRKSLRPKVGSGNGKIDSLEVFAGWIQRTFAGLRRALRHGADDRDV